MAPSIDLRNDAAELEQLTGHPVEVIENGSQIYVVIHDVTLPTGAYSMSCTDVLFITDPQYRCSALDMFWTMPDLVRADGSAPENADQIEQHMGQAWRRFSWHRNGIWNPNRNGLLDHFAFMQDRFTKDLAA